MPVWCTQLCFTFHSHSYLPFPCLGLELNLNQGIFPQQCSCFFFFFFSSLFVRDNSALHESSGPLSVSFECDFNHQHFDSHKPTPLFWLCKYSMSCCPTLWIDKHSWLENFILNLLYPCFYFAFIGTLTFEEKKKPLFFAVSNYCGSAHDFPS